MDARRDRGRALANDKRIRNVHGAMWLVPSASQNDGAYVVDTGKASCTCPDFETRRAKCKHQWAVELSVTVTTAADGSQVVTETVKVTRKTYSQDWPAYNAAQCSEKATVQGLLRSLCDGIVTPPHPGRGPKPIPLADAVFGMTMKVYTTVSGRRATTDIKACAAAGHMTRAPHYNSLFNYFEKPEMTPLLTALIEESAAPLAAVEPKIAIDSTGGAGCSSSADAAVKSAHRVDLGERLTKRAPPIPAPTPTPGGPLPPGPTLPAPHPNPLAQAPRRGITGSCATAKTTHPRSFRARSAKRERITAATSAARRSRRVTSTS
jgi:hypothetical protein